MRIRVTPAELMEKTPSFFPFRSAASRIGLPFGTKMPPPSPDAPPRRAVPISRRSSPRSLARGMASAAVSMISNVRAGVACSIAGMSIGVALMATVSEVTRPLRNAQSTASCDGSAR